MNDPAGVRWETFFTFGEATTYGEDPAMDAAIQAQAAQGQVCFHRVELFIDHRRKLAGREFDVGIGSDRRRKWFSGLFSHDCIPKLAQ